MKPLAVELHLLKEAADSKVHQRQVDPLGLFYQLQEELNAKYTDEDFSSLLTSEMKRLTSKLREFMHNLTSVGQGDQGVLLEIFWRQVVKLVDFSLGLHETTLFKKISAVQTSFSSKISTQRRRMTLQGDSVLQDNIKLRSEVAALQDQVKALSSKLEEVKQENYELVREKISVETGFSRAAQLTSMSELLWKIDRYISESEAEHANLADIMVGLHEVIKASKNESGEKSFTDKATQTLWTVKQSPLPMRHTPLVSDHEFYDLFHLEGLQPNGFIGLDSLEQVLRSANTARDFNFNLTVQLLRKHTKLELISASLIEVFKQVKPNSSREWVFHQLMFLERHLPVQALKYIQTLLLQLDSLGAQDLVAFSEVEGLVTQIFSQDLQAAAEVFSSLEAADLTLPEPPEDLQVLMQERVETEAQPYVLFLWTRLNYTLKRKKTSWRNVLNLADLNEHGSVKITHLARLLRTKLQMLVTDREVFIFCRVFRPVAGRISREEALKVHFKTTPDFAVSKFGVLKAALKKWSDRLDATFKERVPILSESLDDYLSRVKLLSPNS
jgi:hypothetical protein